MISKIYLIIRCVKCFSWSGLRFLSDVFEKKYFKTVEPEIHHVIYNGRKLYYRTGTTDIPLIILILLGKYNNGKAVKQYDFNKINLPKDIHGALDLGANIGLFSLKLSKLNPAIKIVAVEPETENFRLLKINTKDYGNIEIINAGVWYRNTRLHVVDGLGDDSFYVKEDETGGVEGLSIDQICKDTDIQAELLKIDIEGSERFIFEHIDDCGWINNCCALIIETHDRFVPGCNRLVQKTMSRFGFDEFRLEEDYVYIKKENV